MNSDPAERHDDDADDLRLIDETIAGDPRAFGGLVERYTPVLYSLAHRYLRRQEESEDAVQEIFLRAYDALPRFRRDRRFYSWLYTIGVNYLRNVRDKRMRRGTDTELPYEDRVATGEVRTPLGDPERELERREAEALLHQAIDRLPTAQRDVVILRQFEELAVAQVAEVLEMPEGTVKTNLHRARRSLAKLMTEGDDG